MESRILASHPQIYAFLRMKSSISGQVKQNRAEWRGGWGGCAPVYEGGGLPPTGHKKGFWIPRSLSCDPLGVTYTEFH